MDTSVSHVRRQQVEQTLLGFGHPMTSTLMLWKWVPIMFWVVLITRCRAFLSCVRRITGPRDSLHLKQMTETSHYTFKIIIHVTLEHTYLVSLQRVQLPSFDLRPSWKTVSYMSVTAFIDLLMSPSWTHIQTAMNI